MDYDKDFIAECEKQNFTYDLEEEYRILWKRMFTKEYGIEVSSDPRAYHFYITALKGTDDYEFNSNDISSYEKFKKICIDRITQYSIFDVKLKDWSHKFSEFSYDADTVFCKKDYKFRVYDHLRNIPQIFDLLHYCVTGYCDNVGYDIKNKILKDADAGADTIFVPNTISTAIKYNRWYSFGEFFDGITMKICTNGTVYVRGFDSNAVQRFNYLFDIKDAALEKVPTYQRMELPKVAAV